MISPQRHQDHRENPLLTAGDGLVAPPCFLCPGSDDLCKTNPIWPGRGRLTEEIVQNEAKLGGTGVCGQRRLSCGARPGSETCKTNPVSPPAAGACRRELCKTNPIWPSRLVSCGESCETNPIPGGPGATGPGAWTERQVCKTKPIRPERPGMGAGRRAAMSRRRANVQNEPNSGRWVTRLGGVSLETGAENDIMGGVALAEGFGDRGFRAVVGRAGEGSS
jgi:hypothetical protein